MTPQPAALAALQRHGLVYEFGRYRIGHVTHGRYWLCDDVLAAWPTQAQEPVGWVIHDTAKWLPQGSYREAIIYSWQEADRIPVYTHPSPSTAALREALRDFLEANELGAHLLDTHPTVVRARTLLSRENTP